MRFWLAALIAVASCYRDSNTLHNGEAADQAVDDQLGFLPLDSEIVIGIDVAALRATPIWSRFVPQIQQMMGRDYVELRDACGFDAFETVQRIAIGFRVDDTDVSGVMVVHGVPGGKLLDCVANQFGKGGNAATRDRGVVVLREGRNNTAWTAVGDIVVVQMGRVAGRDSLSEVIKSGSPLRQSKAFMELYEHLDHRAPVWGAGNGASRAFEDLKTARPRWVDGVIHVGIGVDATVHVRTATPEAARAIDALIEPNLKQMSPFVQRATGNLGGTVLTIDLAVTADQLAGIMAMAFR
jgi:hypothetical protein